MGRLLHLNHAAPGNATLAAFKRACGFRVIMDLHEAEARKPRRKSGPALH